MDGDLLADWLAAGGALLQSLHALGLDPDCWTSVQRSFPTDATESEGTKMNSIWDYIPCPDSDFVVSQYILQNTPIYGLLEGRGGEGVGSPSQAYTVWYSTISFYWCRR